MNSTTQDTPDQDTPEVVDIISARLTLDVTYLLNGEPGAVMLANLQSLCEHAIGHGLLTGETAAEVENWSIDVSVLPSKAEGDALEAEITSYLRQRIEDGNLDAADIPVRLARYGLMAPEAFMSEMRERMSIDDSEEA